MAEGGEKPRLTLERITHLRASLSDGFKAMKKAHADAGDPSKGVDAREKANVLLAAFRKMVDDTIDEYNGAQIDTTSVEYASNELISELKVYKDNIEPSGPYQLFSLVEEPEVSPINRPPGSPSTSGKRLLPSEPLGPKPDQPSEQIDSDANKTLRKLEMSEPTRSKASSVTGGKSKSGSGSTRSSRSLQATSERDSEVAKVRERRKKEKAENELQMAELQRQIAEVQKREQLETKLSQMKEKALNDLHDAQQVVIDLEGEEEEANERERLEAEIGGIPLAEASQRTRIEAWATESGQAKDPKEEPRTGREFTKKEIKKPAYCDAKKEFEDERVKLRREIEAMEREMEEKKGQMAKWLEREAKEEERRRRMEQRAKEEERQRRTTPEAGPREGGPPAMDNLMDIQARMWAATHLQGIRPKAKFSGGNKTDFAKQMKRLETAFETPSITNRQKLQELQHYFEGAAYELVDAEVLRDDAEAALGTALTKLKDKFGVLEETALEMLDDALAGKAIGEKDHAALLNFYAKLTSVYTLAKETGRALDFEARSVIETILKKKLPHLMDAWYKKVVKHRRGKKRTLKFEDFLSYLDDEHAVMEMLANARHGGQNAPKPTQTAKVAATAVVKAAPSGAKKESCAMCGAAHPLAMCATFRDNTVNEKRRVCIQNSICYRCLLPGHGLRGCSSSEKCASCGGSHHTSVHALFAPKTGAAPAAAAGAAAPSGAASAARTTGGSA